MYHLRQVFSSVAMTHIRRCFIFLFVLFERAKTSAEKSFSWSQRSLQIVTVFSSSPTNSPLALAVMNKSSAVDFLSRALDGL